MPADQTLAMLGHLPETREAQTEAIDLLFELRASLFPLGELSRIARVLGEAERIAVAVGDQRRLGMALAYLGNYYYETAQGDLAVDYGERALAIARDLGDPWLEGVTTFMLGQNDVRLGNFARAADLLTRNAAALDAQPHQENLHHAAFASINSRAFAVRALAEMGEFQRAMTLAGESIRLAEAANHVFGLTHSLYALGLTCLRRGELAKAIATLEQGLRIARDRSVTFIVPLVSQVLGYAYALSGRMDEGLPLVEQGNRDANAIGHTGMAMAAQLTLGEVYFLGGREADATTIASHTLDAARRAHWRFLEARVLHLLGDIAAGGTPPAVHEVEDRYREALELANSFSARPLVAHCHLGLGKLCRRAGKREQGQEHLTTATTMYREMDMGFWLEQAEAEIREMG